MEDAAFLSDPTSEYAYYYPSDAVALETVQSKPVLVLLGEPGIGKSDALEQERLRVDAASDCGTVVLSLNLASYNSDVLLVRDLFENDALRAASKTGGPDVYLFLDSLDECRLTIPNVSSLLSERLKPLAIDKFRLRITCRGAVWPNGLEAAFAKLWGDEAVGIYTLAPLRKADVELACTAEGIDPHIFLTEIRNKSAQPFASRPVSLRFLFDVFKRHGVLPRTRFELYRQGCLQLCEEASDSRRDAGFVGKLTSEQRLTLAAYVAATCLLSNRPDIWLGRDTETPNDCVGERTFLGHHANLAWDKNALSEVLDTSLFKPGAPNRVEWAHRTYAEFLAALYLSEHVVSNEHLIRLLAHQSDLDGKFPPQLHEVVAWLAALRSDFFTHVMAVEPELLMRSDVSTAPGSDIAKLAQKLLGLYDAGRLFDMELGLRDRYAVLRHSGLEELLCPYIRDCTKGVVVRRVAMSIAEACHAKSLVDDLVKISLDANEETYMRTLAGYAVLTLGDGNARKALRPLLNLDEGADPEDELRGVALMALWPAEITAKETFAALKASRKSNLAGAYDSFLFSHLLQHLRVDDVATALDWIAGLPNLQSVDFTLQRIVDSIIDMAWQNLDIPTVLHSFAHTAWVLLERHDRIFNHQGRSSKAMQEHSDPLKRRLLVSEMARACVGNEHAINMLAFARDRILSVDDVPWLLEQAMQSSDASLRAVFAKFISALTRYDSLNINLILDAVEREAALRSEFKWLTEPWMLDDPQVITVRDNYYKQKQWQREHESFALSPTPRERVLHALDKCEAGDADAWVSLLSELTLESNSRAYNFVACDVDELPGWRAGSEDLRTRIVSAAKQYLERSRSDLGNVVETNQFNQGQVAAWPALDLLLRHDMDFLARLSVEQWAKWAPVVIGFSTLLEKKKESTAEIFGLAYRAVPDVVIETLKRRAMTELTDKNSYLHLPDNLSLVFDDRIETAFLELLGAPTLSARAFYNLLAELLKRGSSKAIEHACNLVTGELPPKFRLPRDGV